MLEAESSLESDQTDFKGGGGGGGTSVGQCDGLGLCLKNGPSVLSILDGARHCDRCIF